jgi:hypothetical protein
LNIDIGGTSISEFGRVNITGAATLAGTMEITLVNGFTPSLGNSFQVMTFASRAGSFDTILGLDLGGGLVLDPQYSATNLTLVVENA